LAHNRVIDITSRYFKDHPPLGKIEDYILNRQWNLLEEELTKGSNKDAFTKL
jgi:hypothetical protein